MIIDDILDPLKEIGQVVEDLMFTSHRSGTMYTYKEFLVFKRETEEVAIPYPCTISISGTSNVQSTAANSGSSMNPVQVSGFGSYGISISFEAGDYRLSLADRLTQVASGGVIRANDVIKKLANLVRYQDGKAPVEIIQDAAVKGIPQITGRIFGQNPLFEQNQPLLHELGIYRVVIQSISVAPVANHRYQVSLSCVSVDTDEAATKLFLTLDQYNALKNGKGEV